MSCYLEVAMLCSLYVLKNGKLICSGNEMPNALPNLGIFESRELGVSHHKKSLDLGFYPQLSKSLDDIHLAKCIDALLLGYSTFEDAKENIKDSGAVFNCDYIGPGNFPYYHNEKEARTAAELFDCIVSRHGTDWMLD